MIRHALFCLCFIFSIVFAASAQSQQFRQLLDEFDAFITAADPNQDTELRDEMPRRWAGVTPAYYEARAENAEVLLDSLRAIDPEISSPDGAIMRHILVAEIDAAKLDTARIPLNGDWGFFAEPFFAAYSLRLTRIEDAEAWIARLEDVPRYFEENIENMERGLASGYTAHEAPVNTAIEQLKQNLSVLAQDSPLYQPFTHLPDTLPSTQRDDLIYRGVMAVDAANAATADLLAFLEDTYWNETRANPGISTVNGGRETYLAAVAHHTAGAGLSPEEIHALGQSEVARIRGQMIEVMAEAKFNGSLTEFIDFLRTDEQFYSPTPEDLIEKASEMSKRLDGLLPLYFRTLPRMPYTVEAVPPEIAPGYTTGRYSGGDLQNGRPGRYLVNTYRLKQRPLYELPALSAHEAVPGHHLQIALAQELQDVANFRRDYYATAFGEGWALYAEKLAGEAGFYRTPYERFGQLSYEMWRACRLVADTGLHWYGWSREDAAACLKENTALAPLNIETEVTRYIGWPGQALAYKIGELKILELRTRAMETLGDDFDIRSFHDVILGGGAMPLDALEAQVMAWIEEALKQ